MTKGFFYMEITNLKNHLTLHFSRFENSLAQNYFEQNCTTDTSLYRSRRIVGLEFLTIRLK